MSCCRGRRIWMFVVAVGVIGGALLITALQPRAVQTENHAAFSNNLPDWARTQAAGQPIPSMQSLREEFADAVLAHVRQVGAGGGVSIRAEGPRSEDLQNAIQNRALRGEMAAPENSGSSSADQRVIVDVRWQDLQVVDVPWWPSPLMRGAAVADIRGPRGTATVRFHLDEKPWLNDLEPELGGRLVVVANKDPATSESEAVAAAQAAAVERLALIVLDRAGEGASDAKVRAQVASAVASGQLTLDRYIVPIERPYGTLWVAALLLDGGPEATAALAANARAADQSQRQTWARQLLSLGGMVGVLALVYAALNGLTRGYFRGTLRAGLAGAALVGGTVVLLLLS